MYSQHSRPFKRPQRPGGAHRRFRAAPHNNASGTRQRTRRTPDINISAFINKNSVAEEPQTIAATHRFVDFDVAEDLKRAISARGYELPTPIQDQSIPHILRGSDVVGLANTGTGKTAAFLIPLLHKIVLDRREKVLIIAPTRELALQIDEELHGFAKRLTSARVYSVVCVGGVNINPQIRALRHHNHFVIGTPGRLLDLVRQGVLKLSDIRTVVLDEADRMLDMGFIKDMRALIGGLPAERHTLFFSATMSPDVQTLVGEFLRSPVTVSVKVRDTAKNIEQDIVRTGGNKVDTLHSLLSDPAFTRVIVFSRTKHGAEKLSRLLSRRGVTSASIHSNKSHGQRQVALRDFKQGKVQVLVATDIAARGLDIADVSHVINYDIPATYEDYIHRIGRTGRGHKRGKALTFVE